MQLQVLHPSKKDITSTPTFLLAPTPAPCSAGAFCPQLQLMLNEAEHPPTSAAEPEEAQPEQII